MWKLYEIKMSLLINKMLTVCGGFFSPARVLGGCHRDQMARGPEVRAARPSTETGDRLLCETYVSTGRKCGVLSTSVRAK